ncbi:MAG: ACT domain-containing protein [Devosia sp.]
MAAETDLARLLVGLAPALDPQPFGYAVLPLDQSLPAGLVVFALLRETEGLTVIAEVDALLAAGISVEGRWARITMMVHSALDAVGLTAAMAKTLTAAGISANVLAGYHHDHLLVPWDRRHDAVAALLALASAGPA